MNNKMQVKGILLNASATELFINIYAIYFIDRLFDTASVFTNFHQRNLDKAMRLTAYTDYTLRTLMYLGLNRDRLVTIQDIAESHGISKNNLMKVVHRLGMSGMVETVRGRNGGLKLNKEPTDINIGEVVRNTETDFFMAECFDRESNTCIYAPSCALKKVLGSATAAYLEVLDGVTLDDLIGRRGNRKAAVDTVVSPIRIHPGANKKNAGSTG